MLAALILAAGLAAPGDATSGLAVHIVGNHFVDAKGTALQLVGVNRSGSEFACMAGRGVFDGPSDTASIQSMAAWHVNAVRVPLNEDCWLGINGAPPAFSGSRYRETILSYVQRLHDAGLYAVLDLHWNAQGRLPADGRTGQGRKMADRDHAPDFWRSVATTFRDDPAAVFDLFNEPHDISWACWRAGCWTTDGTGRWRTAGMQLLLDVVRKTGANNPVLVAGLGWGGDLRGWPDGLHDPAHQLAASWHVYHPGTGLDALRDTVVRPLLSDYPMVVGEFGEKDCAHGWADGFMRWADELGVSYLAWTWDTWPDCGNPVLISRYDGTPTAYGVGIRDHLAVRWQRGAPVRVLDTLGANEVRWAVIAMAILLSSLLLIGSALRARR